MPTTRPANKKTKKIEKESSSQQQTSSSRCRSLWGSITCVYCRCDIWLFFLTVGARFYTAKYLLEDDIQAQKFKVQVRRKNKRFSIIK
jgi:hypothetical protein